MVGGGAAAVSTAANLASTWPDKQVDLYFPGERALPLHHPRVWAKVRGRLAERGVACTPATAPSYPRASTCDRITDEPVEWSTGQPAAPADATVWAIGRVRPNTEWLPDAARRRRLRPGLARPQPPGQPGVFAIGDVAATDPLRSSARNRADRLLAKNIRAHLAGKPLEELPRPAGRWGSVLGVQPNGLEVFAPNGKAFRFPAWSIETVLQPWIVRRGIYGGVRRRRTPPARRPHDHHHDTPTTSRTYPSLRAAWIPLAALCLAFFVEMVDNTLLSIALPTIGRDLGSGTTALQWVTGAYSLTFGGLLLTAGSMADRLGRRRVLLVGLAVFGLLSLCVVAVTTAGELIALRAALGIAAAAMAPITNSLVFRLFDDKALRMRAMTVMIVVGMSGFVLGPLLGGTALAHVRWEWLLVVNAPIALIACIGVRLGVPADRPEDLTDDALDLPGAVLSITTIGLACYSLTSGVEHGWLSAITLASIVGAVAAGAAFVRHERRSAAPMLDLEPVLQRHRPRRRRSPRSGRRSRWPA